MNNAKNYLLAVYWSTCGACPDMGACDMLLKRLAYNVAKKYDVSPSELYRAAFDYLWG